MREFCMRLRHLVEKNSDDETIQKEREAMMEEVSVVSFMPNQFIGRSLSSSPFPTRWRQRPEFLIARMFCSGYPQG